jgi:glycosyltransferase involved in cell wall biosynthesis
MKKFTVLQVIPDFNSGGVERGTFEIASYLQKHKVKNFVCSNGGSLVSSLKEIGGKHIRMSVHSKNPIVIILNAIRLYKNIKEKQIDIVHARSRAPAWSCYLACLLSGRKFVTTFHGAYSASHPLKRFYNSIMLKGQRVIAISNYIKKHIETRYHFTSPNLVVIERGADLNYFNPDNLDKTRIESIKKELGLSELDPKEKLIILPSRFTRLKGHLYLIKSLKYLTTKKFKCLMVGKAGPAQSDYLNEIKQAIREYKLEDKIIIKDEAISDMPALYSIADLVVSSSVEPEGFGRTIVEAQAMRRIVISTNIGAPQDIIEQGKSGFLVPTSDASTFAESIEKALNLKKEQAKEITDYAHKLVSKKYSLDLMCKNTLKLYQKIFDEHEGE